MTDEYKALISALHVLRDALRLNHDEQLQVSAETVDEAADAIETLEESLELWRLTAKEATDELLGIAADMERYKAALIDMVQVVDTAVYPDLTGPIWDAVRHVIAEARKALQETDNA